MADITTIAEQFINYYYQTFAAQRPSLGALYRPTSMLTFEGQQFSGGNAIAEKLSSLPFQSVAHRISTKDVQPLDVGIVIQITGQILIDGETNPQQFSQTFVLKPDAGSFYVQNDIFRLVYGA